MPKVLRMADIDGGVYVAVADLVDATDETLEQFPSPYTQGASDFVGIVASKAIAFYATGEMQKFVREATDEGE